MIHLLDEYRVIRRRWAALCLVAMAVSFLLGVAVGQAAPVTYPVIWVSSPRPGGDTATSKVPDASAPLRVEAGSDLMLLPANTTVPTVLVAAGPGAVLTPFVDYDGLSILYSFCPDVSPAGVNASRFSLPKGGCDIWRIVLATGVKTKIIGQDVWRPRGAIAAWSTRPDIADPAGTNYLGYGIMNLSPVPLSGGDIFFISNLAGLDTIKGFMHPSMQGFIWHADTNTVEQTWFAPTNILDAAPLSHTGEITFATQENSQSFGKPHRWGIWSILPDGRAWRPLFSATMEGPHTRHFCSEFRDNFVCASYYLQNNAGLGTLLKRPLFWSTTPSLPEFGSPTARSNAAIPMGNKTWRFAYTPAGTSSVTPMFHTFDEASHTIPGTTERTGKAGFPWSAPDGLLISYSPGPANHAMRPINTPMPQLGIYLIPDGNQIDDVKDLVLVYDALDRNEFYARPVVPYAALFGVPTPKAQPTRPVNDGTQHAALPPGTPYALIGSSSVYHRESCGGQWTPGWQCAKPVYSIDDNAGSNRSWQGGDTYKYDNAVIHALQILVQQGVSHLSAGPAATGQAFTRTFEAAGGNERFSVLADVPLRKFNASGQPILDPLGAPDTSFLAKIPADTPFTFRLVDKDGMVLTHSPTWHQLRPGEVRHDCGGCHAHNSNPLHFVTTAAGQPGFVPTDLTQAQPRTREFHRDVEPVLTQKCGACHNPTMHAGNLDLVTTTPTGSPPSPRNYAVLAKDQSGTLAGPTPIRAYVGRASRYIAPFAAAESLLVWASMNRRLDGVDNAARPTPADPASVPVGFQYALADLDYTPSAAHAALGLSPDEVKALVEWIDLGEPRDVVASRGWLQDELIPVVSWHDPGVSVVPSGPCPCPGAGGQVTLGLHDVGSGLDLASLEVTRDGTALTATPLGEGRWSVPRASGLYVVRVKDRAGNSNAITRRVP